MTTAAESLRNMNFKVDPDFHRGFKMIAAKRGMTMKELFEASVRVWVDKESDESIEPLLPKGWDSSYVSRDGRVVRDEPSTDMTDKTP